MRRIVVLIALSACGGNTDHCGTIEGDEAWAAGTHHVTCDVTIASGQVTVAAGAEVIFADATGIFVGDGALVTEGTEAEEVLFRGEVDGPATWEQVVFWPGSAGAFAHTRFRNAGQDNGGDRPAALTLSATQVPVDGLTLEDGGALGFVLRAGGGFAPGSTGLVVTGNGAIGEARDVSPGFLPADSALTGNLADEIEVGGTVDADSTWPAFEGVDYRVIETIAVEGDGEPVLTLSPGSRFVFDANGLTVGTGGPGALDAVGTDDDPIVFTSAAELPGTWLGIAIDAGASGPLTTLRHLDIGYGGEPAGLTVRGSNPTIDSVALHDNDPCGLFTEDATPTLGAIDYANNTADVCP